MPSSFHPFRLRYLSAVLNRLSVRPGTAQLGATYAEWCRREQLHVHATATVDQARELVQAALFADLPDLALTAA